MLSKTLSTAVIEQRRYLDSPPSADTGTGGPRDRIERLAAELDAARKLAGMDRASEGKTFQRQGEAEVEAEAWDQWRMEEAAREMEEAEEEVATPEGRGKSGHRADGRDMERTPEEDR
jgi:hypothetical protein